MLRIGVQEAQPEATEEDLGHLQVSSKSCLIVLAIEEQQLSH